jgi:hypothetical protein
MPSKFLSWKRSASRRVTVMLHLGLFEIGTGLGKARFATARLWRADFASNPREALPVSAHPRLVRRVIWSPLRLGMEASP